MEFVLAREWKMSNSQALQAGTSVAAQVLDIHEATGILREGMTPGRVIL
jgi:imidazolonepropionase-like amidohydrolase